MQMQPWFGEEEKKAICEYMDENGFITEFRKAFEDTSSQLLMTSHNERAINRFSNHNIFVLSRSSHLSPTKVKVLKDINYISSTVTEAFENDELEIE